jgi:hypothetical protein
VKKALLSLAVAGLALSVAQQASAQISNPTPSGQKMRTITHGPFNIAEAYFANAFRYSDVSGGDAISNSIRDNRRWCGETQTSPNTTAAPGILSFCTRNFSTSTAEIRQRININAFAQPITGEFGNVFVQSFRLIKEIPESKKCPATYQAQTFVQFGGNNVRTWWALTYTSPGTTFTLELTVRSQRNIFPFDANLHIERWIWRVVVSFDALHAVIDLLHENAISTSEIPCIAAENMYIALKQSVDRIEGALKGEALSNPSVGATSDPDRRRINAQNELFNLEALITVFCVFGDCFESTGALPGGVFFQTFPPGNDTQMSLSGAMTGILDTPENPCCCKLLVDVERLGEAYGIVSPL